MSYFLSSIFPIILILTYSAEGFSSEMAGRIFVKTAGGAVYAMPSSIEVSEQVSLHFAGRTLVSTLSRSTQEHNGSEIVSAVFTNLPKGSELDAFVMRGIVTDDGGLNGDFYVKRFSTRPSQDDLSGVIDQVQSNQVSDLSYESAFSFGKFQDSGPGFERILIGHKGGRIVFARLIYDNSDPSVFLGCWTNAGVGRNAEYYQGKCPIQGAYYWEASANGRVFTAAGFERGVPYSWTRAGQLQSLLVGVERTRVFNDVYLNYSRPNFYGWGFFYLFPWQIMF